MRKNTKSNVLIVLGVIFIAIGFFVPQVAAFVGADTKPPRIPMKGFSAAPRINTTVTLWMSVVDRESGLAKASIYVKDPEMKTTTIVTESYTTPTEEATVSGEWNVPAASGVTYTYIFDVYDVAGNNTRESASSTSYSEPPSGTFYVNDEEIMPSDTKWFKTNDFWFKLQVDVGREHVKNCWLTIDGADKPFNYIVSTGRAEWSGTLADGLYEVKVGIHWAGGNTPVASLALTVGDEPWGPVSPIEEAIKYGLWGIGGVMVLVGLCMRRGVIQW